MTTVGLATLFLFSGVAGSAPVQGGALGQQVPSEDYVQRDVRDVLRELFRRYSLSYSIAPEVQGTVSAHLRNVTLETALQTILRQVDASCWVEAGVVHIVPRNASYAEGVAQPAAKRTITTDGHYVFVTNGGTLFKLRTGDLGVVDRAPLSGGSLRAQHRLRFGLGREIRFGARGRPLRDVINSIVRPTGLTVEIAPEVRDEVSLDVQTRSVEETLRQVARLAQGELTYSETGARIESRPRRIRFGSDPSFIRWASDEVEATVASGDALFLLRTTRVEKIRKRDLAVVASTTLEP